MITEQAKGIIATCRDVSVDQAFVMLRNHARNHNRKLHELARAVVNDDDEVHNLTHPPQLHEAGAQVNQAVGLLAARNGISIHDVWNELRNQADSKAIPISALAKAMVQHVNQML